MTPIVILAGGLATRLGKLTMNRPKSLVKINGRPFIFWQLKLLEEMGFTKVFLLLGHFSEQIIDFVGDGSDFGLEIKFIVEGQNPIGTGGAVINALSVLPDYFFLTYGDSYLEFDNHLMESNYLNSKDNVLMAICLAKNQYTNSANVIYKNGKVLKYSKSQKDPEMKHEDFGVSIVPKKLLEEFSIQNYKDLGTIISHLAESGKVNGFVCFNTYFEVGSELGIKLTTKVIEDKYGIH